MSDVNTEKKGISAVIQYENKQKRTATKSEYGCGYDLISTGKNGIKRHIEVKATSRSTFSSRWLEPLEYKAMKKDSQWYLYLVTNANSQTPRVFEYDKTQAETRFSKVIRHYKFVFPRKDFR